MAVNPPERFTENSWKKIYRAGGRTLDAIREWKTNKTHMLRSRPYGTGIFPGKSRGGAGIPDPLPAVKEKLPATTNRLVMGAGSLSNQKGR
jgi:hypothetical protein